MTLKIILKFVLKMLGEKSVCLRAVAKATDDFQETEASLTRPSSHPLLANTGPYLHIETPGAMSKKILIDPFWDIFLQTANMQTGFLSANHIVEV